MRREFSARPWQSRARHGATISFPTPGGIRYDYQSPSPPGPMHDRPHSPEPSTPEQRLRVLIADDEPLILRALTRLLERRGHEVQAVPDAYQALEFLRSGLYDAVLVDANMPGGGASVLAYLCETGFTGTKVLMTGELAADARGVPDDVRRLQKPFRYGAVAPLIEVTPQS